MPSSKKPRKKQTKVRAGIPLTIRHGADEETALQLTPHMELMKFREGIADDQSWHTITARLNVGLTAAWQNDLEMDVFRRGLDAVINVRERHKKSGRWALTGDDYRDIGEALTETDNLQLSLTRKQFAKSIEYVFANAGM